LIGGVVALALHVVILFGFQGESAHAPVATVTPEEEIIPLVMPELEPPEAVEIVDMQDAPSTPQLAPPMQMDLPSTVAVSSFIQPVRPTLDPSLTSVGAITIPSTVTPFGAEGGVRLFELKDLDRVPRRMRTVMPAYPHELRRAGVNGDVVLVVIIDVNGSVEVERVVSATNREFEAAAIKAAEQCVFEPPLRAGQRVKARYLWNIPFEIRK
jgi:protein TonB